MSLLCVCTQVMQASEVAATCFMKLHVVSNMLQQLGCNKTRNNAFQPAMQLVAKKMSPVLLRIY